MFICLSKTDESHPKRLASRNIYLYKRDCLTAKRNLKTVQIYAER
jgi:hypothetical protein